MRFFLHVIAVRPCINKRERSLWCLLAGPDHGRAGYFIVGPITSNPLENGWFKSALPSRFCLFFVVPSTVLQAIPVSCPLSSLGDLNLNLLNQSTGLSHPFHNEQIHDEQMDHRRSTAHVELWDVWSPCVFMCVCVCGCVASVVARSLPAAPHGVHYKSMRCLFSLLIPVPLLSRAPSKLPQTTAPPANWHSC